MTVNEKLEGFRKQGYRIMSGHPDANPGVFRIVLARDGNTYVGEGADIEEAFRNLLEENTRLDVGIEDA